MIQDKLLMFDEDAAITVTRNSTNVIDLLRTDQDLGTGENMYVTVIVTTAFTAAGSATLQVAVVTDDNASLSSPTTLQDQPAVIAVASLILGYRLDIRIHPSALFERYLGLVYTVATGPMTAGAINSSVAHDIQRWRAYAKNYATA